MLQFYLWLLHSLVFTCVFPCSGTCVIILVICNVCPSPSSHLSHVFIVVLSDISHPTLSPSSTSFPTLPSLLIPSSLLIYLYFPTLPHHLPEFSQFRAVCIPCNMPWKDWLLAVFENFDCAILLVKVCFSIKWISFPPWSIILNWVQKQIVNESLKVMALEPFK